MRGCWSTDTTSEPPLATLQSPAVDADGSHPKTRTWAPAKPGGSPLLCSGHAPAINTNHCVINAPTVNVLCNLINSEEL